MSRRGTITTCVFASGHGDTNAIEYLRRHHDVGQHQRGAAHRDRAQQPAQLLGIEALARAGRDEKRSPARPGEEPAAEDHAEHEHREYAQHPSHRSSSFRENTTPRGANPPGRMVPVSART